MTNQTEVSASPSQEANPSQQDPTAQRGAAWIHQLAAGVILAALLLAGYGGYRYLRQMIRSSVPERERSAVTVTAATAQSESWPERLTAIGTLEALQGVEVTNSLGGKVVAIRFKSGGRVAEGDLLVQLDSSSEQAELRSLESQLAQARREWDRARRLIATEAIPEQEYEQKATAVLNLEARADAQRAIIAKKQVKAPFGGMLGIRRIDEGAYLEPGTAIVTLQQIDPIFVNFDLPEEHAAVVDAGLEVSIKVSAFPEQTFTGRVSAVSPLVVRSTRSFAVQATLPNENLSLRPGMFADVTVNLPGERSVVTVPQSAITFNAYGESVFLIESGDGLPNAPKPSPSSAASERSAATEPSQEPEPAVTSDSSGASKASTSPNQAQAQQNIPLVARQTFVETGQRRGLRIEILQGLQAGQRVVKAGQIKLADGDRIKLTDEDPTADAPARPANP